MNKVQRTRKRNFFQISTEAVMVLHIGLPIILAAMIMFLYLFLHDYAINPTYALYRYPAMFEYLMLSLTIVIIGAFLFDYITKYEKKMD